MEIMEELNFDEEGLVPSVIQDERTLQVLTLCYMDKEALSRTLEEKRIHVFRRSKGRVMLKGEISGCVQRVKAVYVDCAGNSLLFRVEQIRAACHKGYFTCYFRRMDKNGNMVIEGERVFDPEEVYKERSEESEGGHVFSG